MNEEKKLQILLFRMLPTCLLSRLFGFITRIPLPAGFMKDIITWYSKAFGVRDEYIVPPAGFRTVEEFFTRRLAPGSRSIAGGTGVIVSPVDARVDQYGPITDGRIIQAKGITYSLTDLLPSSEAERYRDGTFMTLYLSPGDYHRIHSPVDGSIRGFFHIPGRLLTVQEYMVKGLPGLFRLNERVFTYITTASGSVAVCMVGAMNVGRISLSYDSLITNRTFRRAREVFYASGMEKHVNRGDEIGIFNLGSTIILLFEKNMVRLAPLATGSMVRMGEKIGETTKRRTKKS